MMKSNSIAVLADSCNDIPQELLDKYHIYILPLMINYKDASYRDRVDITPEQVYERFQEEIPKTSLPLPETIADTFAKIKADGKTRHIGYFANETDAARAYDLAAIQHFGEYARTNAMMGLYDNPLRVSVRDAAAMRLVK